MRRLTCFVLLPFLSVPLLAQMDRGRMARPMPKSYATGTAEMAIKQAMEQLVGERKAYERDLAVLQHLRDADTALTDPMQPHNAIEKAYDETETAKRLGPPELAVSDGIIKAERALESARLSPATADFGRLREIVRSDAIGPAARVVARNGARLTDETLGWIRIQEMISSHLRSLSEIAAESLRAAQQ